MEFWLISRKYLFWKSLFVGAVASCVGTYYGGPSLLNAFNSIYSGVDSEIGQLGTDEGINEVISQGLDTDSVIIPELEPTSDGASEGVNPSGTDDPAAPNPVSAQEQVSGQEEATKQVESVDLGGTSNPKSTVDTEVAEQVQETNETPGPDIKDTVVSSPGAAKGVSEQQNVNATVSTGDVPETSVKGPTTEGQQPEEAAAKKGETTSDKADKSVQDPSTSITTDGASKSDTPQGHSSQADGASENDAQQALQSVSTPAEGTQDSQVLSIPNSQGTQQSVPPSSPTVTGETQSSLRSEDSKVGEHQVQATPETTTQPGQTPSISDVSTTDQSRESSDLSSLPNLDPVTSAPSQPQANSAESAPLTQSPAEAGNTPQVSSTPAISNAASIKKWSEKYPKEEIEKLRKFFEDNDSKKTQPKLAPSNPLESSTGPVNVPQVPSAPTNESGSQQPQAQPTPVASEGKVETKTSQVSDAETQKNQVPPTTSEIKTKPEEVGAGQKKSEKAAAAPAPQRQHVRHTQSGRGGGSRRGNNRVSSPANLRSNKGVGKGSREGFSSGHKGR